MRKLLIALLLLLLGGSGAIGIDKLGSISDNRFEKATHTTVYGSPTASQVLALNYDRQFTFIQNTGTSTAWIWFNTSTDYVAVTGGIRLDFASSTVTGFTKSYQIDSDNLYFGPIQAICAGDCRFNIIEK